MSDVSSEPVEVGRLYAPEAPWFGSFKRCRAVDCSMGEQMMPEGFCSDCYVWVQAEREAERRIVEWLRTPIVWTADAKPYAEAGGMDIAKVEWVMRRTHDVLADAIERGVHRA